MTFAGASPWSSGRGLRHSRIISGTAILAVAVVAGLISYTHIYELSLALHQPVMVARLMPFGIDGLITVGSVVLLQGGRIGWLGIGPGVAISLFANVESGIRYGALAAIWAGVPAISFALACFILEHWVSGQTDAAPESVADAPQPASASETVADAPESDAPVVPGALPDASLDAPQPETVTAPSRPRPWRGLAREQLDKAAREFAAEVAVGERPSVRQIQKRCRAGRPKAKVLRTHLDALIDAGTVASVTASATVPIARERDFISP